MENLELQENEKYLKTSLLPVIPLRGKVAFPHTTITFEVGREKTLKAVQRATASEDKLVFICTQRETEKEEVTPEDLYFVGCVAKIRTAAHLPSNIVRVACEGLYRARARHIRESEGTFIAVVDELEIYDEQSPLKEAHFRTVKAFVKDVAEMDGKLAKETLLKAETLNNADEFIDQTASAMRIRIDIKQQLLEETIVLERLKLFERCLNDELEVSRIEKKIAGTVRQNIDKSQKEYFLREQLKAIHGELGDDGKEEDEYRAKIEAKNLPEELKVKCLKEVDRISKMQPSSPEYTVVTTYLEQVLSLPFTEETTDTESLDECIRVLEADHYGLEKIKERIVEYLAVLKLTGNMKAPILCFVGPPGVGKTSIAKSIARALNRKFVRMSLGGVRDEAEIRGHRRTYIGAMPGRILYGMKNAGSVNPVFLLDEIDKITSDMHGDPAAALLEALDPEQNDTFRDRYLEAPYDLSKVLFVTTANSLDTIPSALRDRMEIVEVSGYTLEEKSEIASRYLLPKQSKANGLQDGSVALNKEVLRFVIEGYTCEAGVRNLERTVGSLCRKIAVKQAKSKRKTKCKPDTKLVESLLGAPKFRIDEAGLLPQIGAVNGLAWTAVGGTTLTVEATKFQGKGEVKLTGKLGEVMKESALIALSYLRSRAESYGIDGIDFERTDLHIHVPEGATPKDGPSAGITMATALYSLLTGKAVRGDIAMTGEITLRGKVLPIGGFKEKSLAARRAGIKTVLLPKDNEKDLEELPAEVKKELRFVPVSTFDEVLAVAICENNEKKKTEKKSVSTLGETDAVSDSVRC